MKKNEKLIGNREFWEKISSLTPGLITVYNVNTGIYRYVNNAITIMLGYTGQEILSANIQFVTSLIHPDDIQKTLEENQLALKNANEQYPGYDDNDTVQFEYRMKHKNGHYLWVHTYAVIFNRDENDQVEEILNITFDITERKNAELIAEQSKINEDYFRDLADQSPFMIWKVNEKGLCTYVNKPWCDFTGLSFEESLELGWGKAFHPDDAEPEYAKFMSCFNANRPYHSKFRVKTSYGEFRWVLAQSNPLKQGTGYIGSLTDITDQEQAQQATKMLMKKKDEFMSIASHELKTPVTSMKAALQIIERISGKGPENNQLHAFIEKANKQVDKLSSLIEDLLDVTKIQSGKMELNKSDFAIDELIKECMDQFVFDLLPHRITFKGESTVMINGDKERLRQVLNNLISNAIKYSPGADKIILQKSVTDNYIKISVTDFGIGIPPENMPYIFDRFFRVHESSHKFSGLGLGLFISAQIIERHEGKVGVDSKEKEGSTFWFTLPANNVLQKIQH